MSYVNTSSALTDMTTSTAKVQAENNAKKTGNSDLDQNAFLQLLMAQMKNQDPMKPMDSSQMLSQQAQFTQISELQKLNKSVAGSNQMMQASSLIGKQVSLTDPDNDEHIISGKVSEAKINAKGATVLVNGQEFPLENILSIKEAVPAT